jgi:hypothetical protein
MSMSAASPPPDPGSLRSSGPGSRGDELRGTFNRADLRRIRLLVHDAATDHLRPPDEPDHSEASRAERVEDFVTAVSEIATNAVVHAGGGGHIRLWIDADTPICETTDTGPGLSDPTAGTTPPAASPHGGYGLSWPERCVPPSS